MLAGKDGVVDPGSAVHMEVDGIKVVGLSDSDTASTRTHDVTQRAFNQTKSH